MSAQCIRTIELCTETWVLNFLMRSIRINELKIFNLIPHQQYHKEFRIKAWPTKAPLHTHAHTHNPNRHWLIVAIIVISRQFTACCGWNLSLYFNFFLFFWNFANLFACLFSVDQQFRVINLDLRLNRSACQPSVSCQRTAAVSFASVNANL